MFLNKGGLAQSEECNVSNVEAPGSKPGFSNFVFIVLCGFSVCFYFLFVFCWNRKAKKNKTKVFSKRVL